jgi:hypothetical protein
MAIRKSYIIACMLLMTGAVCAVPLTFNYQGAFQDSTGKPQILKDSIEFALFNHSVGGTELWKETHFVDAPKGVFSVNLGSKTALMPTVIFGNDSLFLEITKGGIKGSRIKISSVFYSIKASLADSSAVSRKSDSSARAQNASLADSATISHSADHAVYADSAGKSGQKIWDIKGSTAFFNNGNVGVGTDSAKEKLNVAGNMLAENSTGDVSLSLLAGGIPSVEFKQKGGLASDSRAKFLFCNNALYVNIWDSTGANEIPGVIIFRQKGNVLEAKGTVKASSFMAGNITLNVPDYVFDDSYSLGNLSELDTYIKEHHHLPGVPSSSEMNKDGMDLTQMNLKLLEKVEELTLYIIRQGKAIRALEENVKDGGK